MWCSKPKSHSSVSHEHVLLKPTGHWNLLIMTSLVLFQLPAEGSKAFTFFPRPTSNSTRDSHLLDWIRHQTSRSATPAVCRAGPDVVPIPTLRCHSSNCAVHCYCVRDYVLYLQESRQDLFRKDTQEVKGNLNRKKWKNYMYITLDVVL